MTYNPALDGIRAISVFLVFVFHTGLLSVGWIGVQVFFVLSGFLITGILLDAKKASLKSYLKRFYWRRTLRIFPVYYITLAVIAVIYLSTDTLTSFGNDFPYLATYTQNFARLRPEDLSAYFVHFWSLAVEEQFYLIWPFVVFFLPINNFKKLLIGLIVFVPIFRLALGLSLDEVGAHRMGVAVYSIPISHFDAFAIGAALAVFDVSRFHKHSVSILLGVSAVTGAIGVFNLLLLHSQIGADWKNFGFPHLLTPNFLYFYGYTVLNIASAAVIFVCLRPNIFSKLLAFKPLVSVGQVSYGFYLFHNLIIGLCRHYFPDDVHKLIIAIVALTLTLAASYSSYFLIERRFLKMKDKFQPAPIAT